MALGFLVALLTGVLLWFPITVKAYSAMGGAGAFLLAVVAFIPIFVVMARPSLLTYMLFSAVTEGYVLAVIPVYAYALGPIAWGIVAGGAAAFALIGLAFSQEDRSVGEGVGRAAFWMILLSLVGSIALIIGGIFGWYSWHLDLLTTGIAFVGFLLFAAYDASRVRTYPDEYRAATALLIDLVGIIVELLRLVLLLQRRD